MKHDTTLEERFLDKVNKTDACWMWVGARNKRGYGNIQGVLAHRISWELYNGPIPDGLLVCHRCDTPGCVNPDHLFLGTHQDNSRDMIAKGRGGRTKLKRHQVLDIWHRIQAGEPIKHLAEEYHVTPGLIYFIKDKRIHKLVLDSI